MTQKISDLLDRSSLFDQSCGKAVAQKMSATSLNRDPGVLESSAHNPRYGTAVGQRPNGWNVREKNPAVRGLRAHVKHVLGQCCARLLEQRHNAVTMSFGVAQHQLRSPPTNVADL
jgi:hypothetical protein